MSEILLTRGVAEVVIKEHLESALKSGEKLRIKFGIDPTSPDLHLGHTVPLRKLRQFQDAGHKAVLIIGDFTATIGDPSGRSETRKPLTEEDVRVNMEKYLVQAGKIIDIKNCEVRYNSEWLSKMDFRELQTLMTQFTTQQLIEREDFHNRIAQHKPLWMSELMYPILQAQDSVMVKADIEIGGTDQKFNLLAGRALMEKSNMSPQDIVTVPLLEGTDGVRKMSKSYDNYIALNAEPLDMFGKVMAIPDELINKYYELLTDFDRKIDDPRESKLELAKIIVDLYNENGAGERAKDEFIKLFSKHEKPEHIDELKTSNNELEIVDLLLQAGIESKSEARRLIEQGGVKINDAVKNDINETVKLKDNDILQIGKRRFFKLKT